MFLRRGTGTDRENAVVRCNGLCQCLKCYVRVCNTSFGREDNDLCVAGWVKLCSTRGHGHNYSIKSVVKEVECDSPYVMSRLVPSHLVVITNPPTRQPTNGQIE